MADRQLSEILLSGEIQEIRLATREVRALLEALEARINENVLPEKTASSALPNSLFRNTDIDRVCWKSPGGLVFRLRMQLV